MLPWGGLAGRSYPRSLSKKRRSAAMMGRICPTITLLLCGIALCSVTAHAFQLMPSKALWPGLRRSSMVSACRFSPLALRAPAPAGLRLLCLRFNTMQLQDDHAREATQ